MFNKVLIANRGEIAVRIIRTLREMGITSVAAFSDADQDALFVQEADEAYRLGPAPPGQSYLNIEALLSVAKQAGAQAVHPGYGFLAENAPFARAVIDAGLTFIGPSPEAMEIMGDKVRARQAVHRLGVPIVPGTPGPVENLDEALEFGRAAGYPIAVKAAGGGGGRGIRVVESPDGMASALESARREAEAYFKNPEVYLERYYPDPRHVEFQILADATGHTIHLGERDCSTQRRHQKLIEESPSPAVDAALRGRMGEAAIHAARSAGYISAGTVEFLLTREGEFFFLEMNTRIQVEHPVTEEISGLDLIREMVLIAAGEPMTIRDSLAEPRGHAIEVRINAEDPAAGFRPTPTTITRYREPGGIGVRVDSGVYAGYTIPSDYDSLMAKLITWAPDRESCRLRMLRALDEFRIAGPSTTIPFSRAVLESPAFIAGEVGTTFVEHHLAELTAQLSAPAPPPGPAAVPLTREPERTFAVDVNRKVFTVRLAELRSEKPTGTRPTRQAHRIASSATTLTSPMHGTVVAVRKAEGDQVQQGETIFIIEAMKMENEIAAHRSGTLAGLQVSLGETVETDQPLATIE